MYRFIAFLLLSVPCLAATPADVGTVTGSTLTLKDGVQNLTDRLVIPETIHTVEGGKNSVLQFSGNISPECLGTLVKNHGSLTLKNFEISGDHDGSPMGSGPAGYSGIGVRKVDTLTIENVEVHHVPGMGITSAGVIDITIRNCIIHDTGRDGCTHYGRDKSELVNGVWIESAWKDGRTIESLKVIGCDFWNIGDDACGVWLSSGAYYTYHTTNKNVLFAYNRIVGASTANPKNFGRGIALGGVDGATIVGNRFINMPDAGVWIGYDAAARHKHNNPARVSSNVSVLNNLILDTGKFQGTGYAPAQVGIEVREATGCYLANNTIRRVYVNATSPEGTGVGIKEHLAENVITENNNIICEKLCAD